MRVEISSRLPACTLYVTLVFFIMEYNIKVNEREDSTRVRSFACIYSFSGNLSSSNDVRKFNQGTFKRAFFRSLAIAQSNMEHPKGLKIL